MLLVILSDESSDFDVWKSAKPAAHAHILRQPVRFLLDNNINENNAIQTITKHEIFSKNAFSHFLPATKSRPNGPIEICNEEKLEKHSF